MNVKVIDAPWFEDFEAELVWIGSIGPNNHKAVVLTPEGEFFVVPTRYVNTILAEVS